MSVAAFQAQIDAFADSITRLGVEHQRRIVSELFSAIVLATPVGNATRWKGNIARAARGLAPLPKGYVGGQARRNWRLSIGGVDRNVKAGTDASGGAAIGEAYGVLAGLREPVNMWISNPLPYMQRLEQGWSKQAHSIVRGAVRAVAAKYGLRSTT